ncbi:MAG TPA: hypothetical protein VFW43_08865, partial [Polaromonas sp.]|nr:hypothetical protein [Polaromonas sp.]
VFAPNSHFKARIKEMQADIDLTLAFPVAMVYPPDKKVNAIVSVIRDETSRFEEERSLRNRLTELEAKSGSVK